MGNATSVAAMMGSFVSQDDFDYEDFAQVLMTFENGVHREVREWVECCLNDTEPPIPGEEGMRNVEIAEAARLSAREGRVVELPL
jgi:predicted dehydrogenase